MEILGARDGRTALAQMYIARWESTRGLFKETLQLLEVPLQVFSSHPDNLRYEVAARTLIAQALEKLGRRDEATDHLLFVGKHLPQTGKYLPISRDPPAYYPPGPQYGHRDGWVMLEFTVDEAGFTRDHQVVGSDGGKAFQQSAIKAAKKFRYVPRFKDGKPVETPGTRQEFIFRIAPR